MGRGLSNGKWIRSEKEMSGATGKRELKKEEEEEEVEEGEKKRERQPLDTLQHQTLLLRHNGGRGPTSFSFVGHFD